MNLSIIVLTHNNQDLIEACLKSAQNLGEIIIIDDFSIDKTLELAKKYPVSIIQNKLSNFASQRNFALSKVKTPWVLFLDSDEQLTPALTGEIKATLTKTTASAFKFKRLNYFYGQPMKHAGYWPDWQTRLFKLADFTKYTGAVHETPHFKGTLGSLDNHLLHFSHRNLIEGLQKSLVWTPKEAAEFIKTNHPQITRWRIIKVMVWEFCYRYFKKLGFLDGYRGLIESLIQAINRFFVYQQVWELQQK